MAFFLLSVCEIWSVIFGRIEIGKFVDEWISIFISSLIKYYLMNVNPLQKSRLYRWFKDLIFWILLSLDTSLLLSFSIYIYNFEKCQQKKIIAKKISLILQFHL